MWTSRARTFTRLTLADLPPTRPDRRRRQGAGGRRVRVERPVGLTRSCPSSRAPPASVATCTGIRCRQTTTSALTSTTTAISCTSPATTRRGRDRGRAPRSSRPPATRRSSRSCAATPTPCRVRPSRRTACPARRSSPMWNGWPALSTDSGTSWNGGVPATPRPSWCAGRSTGATGQWTVAGSISATWQEPWLDSGGPAGPNVWYQVTAVSPDEIAGPGLGRLPDAGPDP